jgi:preprotein translocase subunit SecG
MFLPVNSLGLLFVGLGILLVVCVGKKKAALSVAPVLFGGGMVFIMMMVVGLGGMCAGLSVLASKMKKSKTIILFVLSFVCAMGMGYMSSQDSSQAWVNWVEQSINTVSQFCLMLGVITLHKAGLADYQFREANP